MRAAWSAALEDTRILSPDLLIEVDEPRIGGWGLMAAEPAAVGGTEDASEVAAEEIARPVAELVADRIREPFRLVDTQIVARLLAVSEEWVREHAAELGAVRVDDGPNGALRFDLARVRAALERRRLERPTDGPRRRSRQRRRRWVSYRRPPTDVKDW
jgi:hypothetical protein